MVIFLVCLFPKTVSLFQVTLNIILIQQFNYNYRILPKAINQLTFTEIFVPSS